MANTFKLKTKASVSNSALEAVYTVPNDTTTVVIGCTLSNTSSAAITADVQVATTALSGQSDHDDDVYVVKTAPVPAGGSLEVMAGNKLVLQSDSNSGDVLKAKSSAASALDVVLTIMEIT
jgi:hypothetical protein